MNLSILSSGVLLFFALSFSSCAQKRIIAPPLKQTNKTLQPEKPAAQKNPPVISAVQTAPSPNMISKKDPPAVAFEAKPKEPHNNLSELKKNISNDKISADLIENKLTVEELEAAAADNFFISLKPQILLKIGKLYQKNLQIDKATEYFRSVTVLFPQSTYSAQANVLLETVQTANDVDAKIVGAILPLSGKNASLGQHALNAIRMGLDLNKPDNKFRLALFDSKSDPEHAAIGVEKLVKEDKAIALLGGFTAKEASSIASRSEQLGTPYFGFSQKSGLTNIGDYVFRNSVTPEMQIDKIVQFAFEKLSAKKFAILFPNDSYGVEFSNIFWDHVLARGGEITAAQTYDPKETDFSAPIQKLVGTHYIEARAEEYNERLREIKEAAASTAGKKSSSKKSSRDHWAEENILSPIVDFDVLFVPDNSRALGQILAFMNYNEIKDMKYLGTNIWNSPDLPKRTVNQASGIYFVDALDISPNSTNEPPAFYTEYFSLYNEEPTLVEIQAYETAKIIKDQVLSGATTRESLASNLRSLGRSQGVTGELRMSNQREIERPMHILTLESGLLKKIE